MAKCKYPNEVCANMTVLNGVAYCDSVPCSLKDELPKQTNADKIRNVTDEELATIFCTHNWTLTQYSECLEWLQEEVKQIYSK